MTDAAQGQLKAGVVEANGLTFHTLEAGEGPLVLCLHGFPDHARSFREQLPALAGAGFRAVAPYMRGYGPTGPAPDGRYEAAVLGQDVIALIEALGYEDAIVVGHDWGAVAAYAAAVIAPRRVRKLVTMAMPYGPQFAMALAGDYDQQKRSWYMFFFQSPIADMALANDDFAFVERLWRDWSPQWRLAPEETAALKDTFGRPGIVAATLAHYRQALNPALQDPTLAEVQGRIMMEPLEVPCLLVFGRNDGCISASLAEATAAHCAAGFQLEMIADAGHFVHQEKPAEVNRAVLAFLREA